MCHDMHNEQGFTACHTNNDIAYLFFRWRYLVKSATFYRSAYSIMASNHDTDTSIAYTAMACTLSRA